MFRSGGQEGKIRVHLKPLSVRGLTELAEGSGRKGAPASRSKGQESHSAMGILSGELS
jgi:hypothetical protein